MKGAFFHRPMEFKLSIDGESWNQGDSISGTLVVRNHGTEAAPLGEVSAHLATGSLRKVRAKAADAFKTLASKSFESSAHVDAGGEASLDWSFPTDRNCPITDSLASLFLVYGRGDPGTTHGNLELPVHPHSLIQDYVNALRIQFRFIEKGRKSSKGRVEYKLAPPDSQAFASLEHALVSFRFVENEALEVGYKFAVKKLEATAASVEMRKAGREHLLTLLPEQYRTSFGRVNHEFLESSIREALGTVEKKVIF